MIHSFIQNLQKNVNKRKIPTDPNDERTKLWKLLNYGIKKRIRLNIKWNFYPYIL